jgi:hypothetical protein
VFGRRWSGGDGGRRRGGLDANPGRGFLPACHTRDRNWGENLWDRQRIIGDHGGNDKASYATLETSLALSFFLLLPHGYSRVIWFRLQLIVLNGKQ